MRGSAATLSQSRNPHYNLSHSLVERATILSFPNLSPMVTVLRHHLLYTTEIPRDENPHTPYLHEPLHL